MSGLSASRIHAAWFPGLVRGGVHIISVYLWTSEPPYSTRNRSLIESVAQLVDALDSPWIIGGDWQTTPETLAATNIEELLTGTIVAPTVPTCGDQTIDFFIVATALAHVVLGVQVVSDSLTVPHFAARLVLASGARQRSTLRLKAPRPWRTGFGGVPIPVWPQAVPSMGRLGFWTSL